MIYLSINVQDEAKKPKQFRSQGRDWSIGFIRKLVRTLIDLGVEVSATRANVARATTHG